MNNTPLSVMRHYSPSSGDESPSLDNRAAMREDIIKMDYSSSIRLEKENLTFYQFPLLQTIPGLVHGVFARLGGESRGGLRGLNLSFSVGDQAGRVAGNRKRVRELLNFPFLTSLRQVHGTEAVIISNGKGMDTTETPETESGDILLTDRPGIGLMIKQADCQAVMLYDPRHKALANMHCGWRGNVRGVIPGGIRQMRAVYGTDPADLLTAVGPSLGPCCAEFIHYREEFPEEAWKYQMRPFYFDLWQWSRDQLLAAGVRNENIAVAGICTSCHTDEFYSYRKEKVTGRFGTVIGLLEI
jgi:polyphenol oxidase